MAYIGQDPVIGRYIIVDQISGGFNGTASGFTLAAGGQGVIPGLAQNVLLSLGGVIQQPGTDYTVSGSGITFTTPPLSGTTFFATVLGDVQAVGTPSDGTVLPASIATSGTFVFPNLTTTGTTLIASGNASTPSLAVIGDTNTGLYSPGADQLAISTNGTGRLYIAADGKIGVGVSSPGVALDIGGTNACARTNETTGYTGYFVASTGGAVFIGRDNSTGGLLGAGAYSTALWNYGNNPTVFGTNNSEKMRLDSSGRLGLGTSTPQLSIGAVGGNVLHIVGVGTTGLRVQNTSGNSVDIYAGTDGFINQSGSGSLNFQLAGSTKATLTSTGLGIGTTSPARQLDVNSTAIFDSNGNGSTTSPSIAIGSTGTGLSYIGSQQLAFLTNSAERARIDSSGRVGIGTSSPSEALTVNGRVQSQWNAFVNGGTTSYSGDATSLVTGSTTGMWAARSDSALLFAIGSNEKARIDSSGNVGISTTTPQSRLDLGAGSTGANQISWHDSSTTSYGNIWQSYNGARTTIANGLKGSTTVVNGFQSSTSNLWGRAATEWDYGTIKFYTDAASTVAYGTAITPTERLRIDSSGRVGIGTTSPNEILDVRGKLYLNNGSASYFDAASSGGLIITNPTAVRWEVNSSERARIDSSGRLLVGTSSTLAGATDSLLQIRGNSSGTQFAGKVALATDVAAGSITSGTDLGAIYFGNVANGIGGLIECKGDAQWGTNDYPGRLTFSTTADGSASPTERMRITSDPLSSVLIGQTTNPATSRVVIQVQTGAANGINAQITSNTGTSFPWGNYNASGTYVGGMSCTSTATSFPTSSDYRLKTNVQPLADAIGLVAQLKPSTFEFNENLGETVQGFIAHELQEVVPLAVIGEKDAEDANGNPVYQGVDAAKLVPLLTAALQEAIGEIESLKARVVALESA